jgi:hypothetical protein
MLLRATAASVPSYMFFNRGECSACALVEDLVIDDTHITLMLRHEKVLKILNVEQRNARQVSSSEASRITSMLASFFTRAGAMGPRTHRWTLSPTIETKLWTTNTLSGWLTTAYTTAWCLPPPPRVLHGHRTASARVLPPLPTPSVPNWQTPDTLEVGSPTPRSSGRSKLASPRVPL